MRKRHGAGGAALFFRESAPLAARFVRRHFDQPGPEGGKNIHQIALSGHNRMNILVNHGGFIQSGGEEFHAVFLQPVRYL